VAEAVAGRHGATRRAALAGQQQLRAFAQQRAQQAGRSDRPGGPPQRSGQRRREGRLRDRLRCGQIERPFRPSVCQQAQRQSQPVLKVNPALPVAPVAEPSTETQPKRRQQHAQQAARRVQHQPGAKQANARAERARSLRGGLPVAAKPAQKIVRRRLVLVQPGVAAVAVEPDRRRAEQHGGRMPGAGARRHKPFGRLDAARAQHRPARGAPAAVGDRRTRQIHDRVERLGRPRLKRGERRHRRAAKAAHAVRPPAEHRERMPAVQQRAAERASKEAGPARDQNAHVASVFMLR